MKYETYVTKELTKFIDSAYQTIQSRNGRAISGLSMGGHGALYLSMRHPDIFGAAGSMSGGVDFRPFPRSWDLAKRLGEKARYPKNWDKNVVLNQLYLIGKNPLSIIIDCGVDDFFIAGNRALHKKMVSLKINHDYIERPGGHTAAYWDNALQYQALYFNNFFRSFKKQE
ncbi:MAG: esterase family protein, partial [Ignavibacteriae bacterium]